MDLFAGTVYLSLRSSSPIVVVGVAVVPSKSGYPVRFHEILLTVSRLHQFNIITYPTIDLPMNSEHSWSLNWQTSWVKPLRSIKNIPKPRDYSRRFLFENVWLGVNQLTDELIILVVNLTLGLL